MNASLRRGARRVAGWLLGLVLVCGMGAASAQELAFQPPSSPDDARADSLMRDLAERVLPVYEERDADRFLERVAAMQTLAGHRAAAQASREQLRQRRGNRIPDAVEREARLIDIYVRALDFQRQQQGRVSWDEAYARTFRAAVTPLSDAEAFAITGWRPPALGPTQKELQRSFDAYRKRASVPLAEAVELLNRYFRYNALTRFTDVFLDAAAEDDQRRYEFAALRIPGPQGRRIAVTIARPRKSENQPLASLLEFTIYVAAGQPVTGAAARGYVGVTAYTRGREAAGLRAEPFEHDGEDARAVIDWISKQPWSDGRVAMTGSGYSAFAAWAAAAKAPLALQAIVTTDPLAPGIDMPMAGNIFRNEGYRWAQRVTGSKGDERELDEDDAAWRALDETWYRSGRAYRDLALLNRRPNLYFQRWLNHPSYDRYWQKMIPVGAQFAKVDLPVLTITGFYSLQQAAALHYFSEHQRHHPQADHWLVVGPWRSAAAQPVLDDLRYRWLDYVLKAAPRPAALADRVAFTTQGVDGWRHAPDLQSMGSTRLRLQLDPQRVQGGYLLARRDQPSANGEVQLDVEWGARGGARNAGPATGAAHSVAFISEPFTEAIDVTGVPTGALEITLNRQDVDLTLALHEQRPNGDRIPLFDPPIAFRASYAADRTQRRLLQPGKRERIELRSERVTSHRVAAGSRLMLTVSVVERGDRQINYGSGKDVSEETAADGRRPLRLTLHAGSYMEVLLHAK
jgi:putative CocE/NonD family hydrolase